MSNGKRVVWLIEDDKNDAEEYERFLEESGDLEVFSLPPRPSKDDYVDLLTNPDTAAIIIDQRLSDYADAAYDGLGLANYLRSLRPEIPIYILTNVKDDVLESNGQSVDAIIKKDNVRDYTEVTVARILRSIKRYEESLDEKQHRLRTLIDRKIANELSEDEEKELQMLRDNIERPVDLALSDQEQKKEAYLQEQEQRLAKLEKIAEQFISGLAKDKPESK